MEVKKGQIAHVDQDRSNNKEENLAFLCLEHHDEYDTKPSQSKNLTEREVKHYRDLLYRRIESQADADPITIAIPVSVAPRGRRPVYPPVAYQEEQLEQVLQTMCRDGRKEFSLYDFETFIMSISGRDGISPVYEPLTLWGVREALEKFIQEGKLVVTENVVVLL
jgi:hypothetical protein